MTFTKPLEFEAVSALYARLGSYPRKYRVLVDLCLETGYRVSDVLPTRWIDIKDGKLSLVEGKTGKARSAVIDAEVLRLIRDYMRLEGVKDWQPLIRSSGREPERVLSRVQAYRVLSSIGRECGVKVSPHCLRKTYAIRLYRRTGSLRAVQESLNHESIGTTVAYVLLE